MMCPRLSEDFLSHTHCAKVRLAECEHDFVNIRMIFRHFSLIPTAVSGMLVYAALAFGDTLDFFRCRRDDLLAESGLEKTFFHHRSKASTR
jgi:hypothetical protein